METNDIVNQLIDLFTGRIMTKHDNDVLFQTVKYIHSLEDERNALKSKIDNHSCLPGANH